MLYIVYSHNFPRKLFTWEVLALGLHYDVFGAVLGPDGLQTGQTNIYCGHSLYQYYCVMILSGRYGLSQKSDSSTQN